MAPARILEDPPSPPSELQHQQDKPTVYFLDILHPEATKHAQTKFNVVLPGTPEHANWRQEAEYLLIRSAYLTADDVASCPNLKAIGKQGVGIDKIDADACAQRGIKIFNTPGVNARAVAELVVALTASVARDIPAISVKQNSGLRVPKESCNGLMLYQKTLGVIGMGNIGKTAAKIFHGGHETPLVAYDPYAPADAWSDLPHTRASSIEEVLRVSDVVTIHVPLTNDTRDLIAYKEITLMKRNAILINASRGGIINEADLERALAEGLIWGAGLDCHKQEPPTQEKYSALWSQRVVSTPHIGAATSQTQMETAMAAVDLLHNFVCAGAKK
jgi:phosphoglycerate dehydrogenase-like enzyme